MSPRSLTLAAAVAAASVWHSPAGGAVSRVPLGKAAVSYDTAIWRTVTGAGYATFTCIAADCAGQPSVFASVATPREMASDLAAARRDSRTLRDDAVPPLPFPAVSRWSGCRALDTPILFAGGQIGEEAYRFVTAIAGGCNRSAPLPEARFLELVRGLEIN